MKQTILTVLMALLTAGAAQAEKRVVTVTDSINNQFKVIELEENIVNGQTVTDTVSITTYPYTVSGHYSYSSTIDDFPFSFDTENVIEDVMIAIVAIACIFGLPVVVIFLIFYYRNKRRKMKYLMAEKILAAGQPLPDDFFSEIGVQNKRSRGIANAFLGIGLFAFLYALTQEFALGCIGILVFCIGLGQVVSFYAEQRDKTHNNGTTNRPNRQPSTGSPNEPAGSSSQPTAYDKPADNPEQTDRNPDNTTLNEQ